MYIMGYLKMCWTSFETEQGQSYNKMRVLKLFNFYNLLAIHFIPLSLAGRIKKLSGLRVALGAQFVGSRQ